MGRVEESLILLDNAFRIVESTGERSLLAELTRHKGRLLSCQGHPDTAEELYRDALAIATAQGAKLRESGAAVILSRLRRDQGLHVEAHNLLAPVYGWFTEGFDTADLNEARGARG